MATEVTLRDHVRGAVRDEVMRAAWSLFSEQGFEDTTVDQIATASGMSRRTFFRYFDGKDELVLERIVEAGERIASELRSRPASEPAWVALRAALDAVVRPQEENADQARSLARLLRTEPGVRGSLIERRRRWQDLLVPLVAERLPRRQRGRAPDLRAAALTASALACLDVAQDAWADHEGTRLSTLLDQAMGAVGSGDLTASDRVLRI
jgi:AcrR family transcriptional regulator